MKQTAVEFLHSEYKKILYNVIVTPEQVMEMADALAQANEMFEQQMEKCAIFFTNYAIDKIENKTNLKGEETFEQYYNETFKNK